MELVCVEKFGDTKPGDVRIVPDGASFDTRHFRKNEPDSKSAPLPLPKVIDKRIGRDDAKKVTKKEEG